MDHVAELSQTKSKLVQLFRYVQAFNLLQNPVPRDVNFQPWLLWFQDLPIHPSIRVNVPTLLAKPPSSEQVFDELGSYGDFLLKVRRPKLGLSEPPKPAEEIAAYLKSDWRNPFQTVTFDPQIRNDHSLSLLFDEWLGKHTVWAENERVTREAQRLFNQLYELRTRLERETEQLELMVGDGILHWEPRHNVHIHHPMLLIRVQLHFDPQIPEFTISETEQPPEFYSALLQGISEVNARDLSLIRQDFDANQWHPLSAENTTSFFQRLMHHLSPKGQFHQLPVEETGSSQYPLMFRKPVLFLRRRTLGFNTAIEAILDDIPQLDQVPYALTSLVGLTSQPNTLRSDGQARQWSSPNGEDEHILLSKPANAEQLEIAQKLEQFGAVLVQGPPGTGKTHTIANLLGHLLAQGKSVLVTSHTSKALRVLHEKIVQPLQPLCVSMLEDNNRRNMECAIDAITERLSSANEPRLEREAASLTRQRIDILRELHHDREDLKIARNSEYETIVVDGQRYTPSDAARYILARTAIDWLQDAVSLDRPLPLSEQELIDLYRTNKTVSIQDEQEIVGGLPEIQKLFVPDEFEHRVMEIATIEQAQMQLQRESLSYRSDLWQSTMYGPALEPLKDIQHQLEKALDFFSDEVPWRLAMTQAGQEGGLRLQVWEELIKKVVQTHTLALQASSLIFEYDPSVPDDCLPDRIEKVLHDVLAYLDTGKKLSSIVLMMHSDWKTVVQKTRILGQPPKTKEHFQALQVLVSLNRARKDMVGRWQRQITPLGAHDAQALGQRPEDVCYQYVPRMQQCLNWYKDTWLPLVDQLRQQGFLWEKLLAELPVSVEQHDLIIKQRMLVRDYLPAVLEAEEKRRIFALNEKQLKDWQRSLHDMLAGMQSTPLAKSIQVAIEERNAEAYTSIYRRVLVLYERRKEQELRVRLLNKLEQVAPAWAASIRVRDGMHGEAQVPINIEETWRCKKLKDELNRRAGISLEDVQERLARNTVLLQTITAELVEKKAWAAQIRRTTLEQRRALQGWKALMSKVGKGTGKRAPQLLAEARQLMPMCQTAVPVWIMPLSRVVQNFNPRQNRFDVVIIDEASQADIKALTAVYMGAQVVVVGDHEQVTPLAVGQNLDDVDRLIGEHLEGIPLKELYDGKLSIYALTQTTFQPICLREHFRCVSPIIQFSNSLSYEGKIKPLRDDSNVQIRPVTIEYSVSSSGIAKSVNEVEAVTLASLLVAACEQPEYVRATMGVISMLREDQALRIDTLLRQHLSEVEYVKRQILCGTAAQFQGDERDVIFLSLVDTPSEEGPLTFRNEDSYEAAAKKRFNVAASRARDQMWVIHSLDPDTHLKDGDIRKKLILHARNSQAIMQELAEQERRVESEFERRVLNRLSAAGYRVISQWPVGAYRIDLVVEGNNKRLAVECDGDRWHPIEKLEEDMARQAILERLGWRFVRIRGSQFFRNPEEAMKPVFARLQALEILPEVQSGTGVIREQNGQELKQRVIRRASELRQQWSEEVGSRDVVAAPAETSSRVTRPGTYFEKSKKSVSIKAIDQNPLPHASANQRTSSLLTKSLAQEHHQKSFDVLDVLRKNGIEYIDLRGKGGMLWIIGGEELGPILKEIHARGLKCTYMPRGGHATKNRAAWYTK